MPEKLLRRIERLERQNVRLRSVLALLVVVAFSVAALGQSQPGATIRTQEIIIADTEAEAAIRAVLGVTEGAPILRFYDQEGQVRVLLSVTAEGPKLIVRDQEGRARDFFNLRPELLPLTR